MLLIQAIITLTVLIVCYSEEAQLKKGWAVVGNPLAFAKPCQGNVDVIAKYEPGLPPGEENQYEISIMEKLPILSKVVLQFDSEATITLSGDAKSAARITTDGTKFEIKYFKPGPLTLHIKGPSTGTIPYVKSCIINTAEYCRYPKTGYFDNLIIEHRNTASVTQATPDDTCGRRKIDHTELIVSGQPTKPGDWPWHVALYRFSGTSLTYICGGTLISKTVVLTAAHCVTSYEGAPVHRDTMNVILGKYNLFGGDISSAERQVHEVIVHEKYNRSLLNHDIALLKLSTEAVYNDYIQPACIWNTNSYKRLPSGQIIGTVVGWGFDQTEWLSSQLQQVKMPKVSESTCLKSHPVFFSKMLNEFKFCAGYRNGSTACNGDSGGGFHIFVPDTPGDETPNATGAWHVRGIVSTSISRYDAAICDPSHYVLFTDIAKYKDWITSHWL